MYVVLSLAGNTLDSLGPVSAWALAVALTLHVLKVVAEARSWHTIVRHAYPAVDVGFGTTFGGFAGAVGANTLLPARIGEALRFGVLRRRVLGSTTTIATTIVLEGVVELIFGVVVVATVLLGGRSLGPVVTPFAGLRSMTHPLALGASLAALGGLVAVVALQRRWLRSLAAGMAQGAAIVDPVIGGAAMAFVARRLDTVGLLGTIRCLVRTPSGGFRATQPTVRS